MKCPICKGNGSVYTYGGNKKEPTHPKGGLHCPRCCGTGHIKK